MRTVEHEGVELTLDDNGKVVGYRDKSFGGDPATRENGRLVSRFWENLDFSVLERK